MKPGAMSGRGPRHLVLAVLSLAGIWACAPWPVLQGFFHAFLVVGLVPEFRSRLTGVLWAAAAGWVLEGTLRTYPVLGGTPLADMLVGLVGAGIIRRWPPEQPKLFWLRSAGLALLQAGLVHACVRIAAGPHAWGLGWVGALAGVPLWASLAFRVHRPLHWR